MRVAGAIEITYCGENNKRKMVISENIYFLDSREQGYIQIFTVMNKIVKGLTVLYFLINGSSFFNLPFKIGLDNSLLALFYAGKCFNPPKILIGIAADNTFMG